MVRAQIFGAALLSIVLLIRAGSVLTQSRKMVASIATGPAMQFSAVVLTVNSFQFVNIWARPTNTNSVGGNESGYGDGNKNDHGNAPKAAPEPSTTLSFVVALLLGGGVLVSRRLLGSRK
jgi:hypothetical protein